MSIGSDASSLNLIKQAEFSDTYGAAALLSSAARYYAKKGEQIASKTHEHPQAITRQQAVDSCQHQHHKNQTGNPTLKAESEIRKLECCLQHDKMDRILSSQQSHVARSDMLELLNRG